MTGIIEKAKDKLQQVTSTGPYAEGGSSTSNTSSTTGTTGTTGTSHTGLTGSHHTTGTGVGGVGSTTAGPHSSNLANKADPRVDSDLDGSRGVGSTGTGLTGSHHTTGTGLTGSHGTGLTGSSHTTGSGLTGSSHTPGSGLTGSHHTTGSGLTGSHSGGLTGASAGTTGPHSIPLANKLDPRVDSDRDGSRTTGGLGAGSGLGSTGGIGSTGAHHSGTGLTGSHHTGTGLTGTHQPGATHSGTGSTTGAGLSGSHHAGGHSGPGPAPNTAGPHSSDLLNKADPRVDSDQDGSKTYGGNATYQHTKTEIIAPDDPLFKPLDKSLRNDSVQKTPVKESTFHQYDDALDRPRHPSPPDAAKDTPSKFIKKAVRKGSMSQEDANELVMQRRDHNTGVEAKEALDKYGSGIE